MTFGKFWELGHAFHGWAGIDAWLELRAVTGVNPVTSIHSAGPVVGRLRHSSRC